MNTTPRSSRSLLGKHLPCATAADNLWQRCLSGPGRRMTALRQASEFRLTGEYGLQLVHQVIQAKGFPDKAVDSQP